MLGVKRSNIIGKNIREIIGDRYVLEFLADGRDDTSKIFNNKGQELLSTRFRIEKEDTTVVTFKDTNRDNQEVERQTRRELYNRGYYAKYSFNDITGRSLQIQQIKAIARKLAVSDLTVLIEGESGTGKELFASAIHNESPRRNKPFVAINFSSISENLVESELFGYEEGAFTGAIKGGKQGLFEQADGGTIFLDEIGDISLKVQSRLLRVLQEKEIMRVGGTKIMPIDVRVIAATNQNLSELVNMGGFRTDLYHRLKVLYIKLSPLRERREDIKALIRQFMEQKTKDNLTIDDEVITKLQQYPWYGNVRELKNTIDYMLAVCDKKHISLDDMPQESFFQPGKMEEDHERPAGIELRGDYECILKALYEEMQRE
jgi:transcriptional regulator with PAS, ATPase and Fis domain